MKMWSYATRYAVTLADILGALDQAILADKTDVRRHLARAEILRTEVCDGDDDCRSHEAHGR